MYKETLSINKSFSFLPPDKLIYLSSVPELILNEIVQLVKLSNKTTWLAWWTKLPTHFSNRSFRSGNDIFNCFVTVLNLLPRTTETTPLYLLVRAIFFLLINTYELRQLFHPVICRVSFEIWSGQGRKVLGSLIWFSRINRWRGQITAIVRKIFKNIYRRVYIIFLQYRIRNTNKNFNPSSAKILLQIFWTDDDLTFLFNGIGTKASNCEKMEISVLSVDNIWVWSDSSISQKSMEYDKFKKCFLQSRIFVSIINTDLVNEIFATVIDIPFRAFWYKFQRRFSIKIFHLSVSLRVVIFFATFGI